MTEGPQLPAKAYRGSIVRQFDIVLAVVVALSYALPDVDLAALIGMGQRLAWDRIGINGQAAFSSICARFGFSAEAETEIKHALFRNPG